MLGFSRRLDRADGSFAGVVVAALPVASLGGFYETLNVGRNGIINVFRRDSVLLARSPAEEAALGRRYDMLELFRKRLPDSEHGTYRARTFIDTVPRVISYRAVAQYPLVVTVSVTEDEVVAGWRHSALIGSAALLILGGTVLALLLWLSGMLKREARSTAALAANEARARVTLETLADGVVTTDEHGIVQACNPAAERMFGYPAATIIGQSADRLIGVGALSQLIAALRSADRKDEAVARQKIEARRSDGRLFPAELRLGLAHGGPGVGDLTIVTVRDLSEETALQHQFEQSQKLEVIGHLTGGIAHDFGNVLAGVTTSLESSMRLLPTEAPAREQIGAALRAARSGRAIVQRLMAFARKQQLNPCSSELNQLVSSMMPLLQQGRGPEIRIETKLSDGLASVLLDRSGIESALLNLVVNACDAMPSGGVVTLETGRVNIGAARASEWGIRPGEYATLTVRDTGSGMTEDIRKRIFEPFFTTKLTGTGLGLSMVQRFAAQSGGYVSVDSTPGSGTRITLYFPMQRGRVGAGDAWVSELASTAPAPSQGRFILVVEDNDIVRHGIMLMLHQLGHRPIAAGDAEAALAQLDKNGDVELLLTDIGLPGMNGRQLARIARRRNPSIRVLFITGYDAANGERPLAEINGSTGLLMKPFFEEDLVKEIARLFHTEPRRPNSEPTEPRKAGGAV